ncbi:hypothetical protein MC885_007794 [Smutsia gigantea]|nr:hypothetical protein MC885_007794 [Smutsia gigantea]
MTCRRCPRTWSVSPPAPSCHIWESEAPSLLSQGRPLVLQVSLLRLRLRKVALAPGEGVSRLFLKAQALLFGGYREALTCNPGQPVTFNEDAFLAQKPGAPLQAFHRRAVHLQLFKQFIEGRLEKLNTGEGFSDLFEQAITCSGASSGTVHSYQLWADNLKKGGGALLHSVKAKTQPAVRNMYRSAKSGLKGMQSFLMYKDGDSGLHRGGSLRAPTLTSRSDCLQQRLPITQHFGQNRPLRPSRLRLGERPESLGKGTPSLSPEDTQDLWAEEALDSSFLGSGEELDLLSEILDSLSTGATRTGSLRPSQSLDCCHRGDPDSCFNLVRAPSSPHLPIQLASPCSIKRPAMCPLPTPAQPDIPGRPRWQPDDGEQPQPLSLPGSLSSLQTPQPSDATTSLEGPTSQPSLEASQEIVFPSQSSAASADPSSHGDTVSPHIELQSLSLHPSPPHEAAKDPRAQESPCPPLSTVSSPPESPQLLVPTKPNLNITWTSQPLDCYSNPGSPENLRSQPEELGALRSPVSLASNGQEAQVRSWPGVAELKKCFEG